jgi:hypothetical protein
VSGESCSNRCRYIPTEVDSVQLMKFYRIPRCALMSIIQAILSYASSRNARYMTDMERLSVPPSYLDTLINIHIGRSQGSRRRPTRTEPFRRVPEFLWGWLSVFQSCDNNFPPELISSCAQMPRSNKLAGVLPRSRNLRSSLQICAFILAAYQSTFSDLLVATLAQALMYVLIAV